MSLKTLLNEEGKETLTVMAGVISEKEDKTGAPYIMVDLLDGESIATARIFKTSKEDCGFKTGDIIEATVVSSLYNGSMGFIANNYSVPDQSNYNKADFIISAPMSFDDMYSEVQSLIKKISVPQLAKTVKSLYEKNKDKLVYWAAAKAMHHNYYGGLMYHSLCVTRNAVSLASNYPEVNMDLVIAGALLHDIGKLVEFNTDELGVADYTVEGNLFGHLFMGAEIVKAEAKNQKLSVELMRQLLHIIVSHHDNPEWGAIKKPSTMEARIVACADIVDAQLEMMNQVNAITEEGSMSEKYIDGAKIYHPITQ